MFTFKETGSREIVLIKLKEVLNPSLFIQKEPKFVVVRYVSVIIIQNIRSGSDTLSLIDLFFNEIFLVTSLISIPPTPPCIYIVYF